MRVARILELTRTAFRPHPACPDGARDGGLDDPVTASLSDPIRLVRMVKQIVPQRISFTIRARRMGSDKYVVMLV